MSDEAARHGRVCGALQREIDEARALRWTRVEPLLSSLLEIAKRHAPRDDQETCRGCGVGVVNPWPCPDFLDVEKVVPE